MKSWKNGTVVIGVIGGIIALFISVITEYISTRGHLLMYLGPFQLINYYLPPIIVGTLSVRIKASYKEGMLAGVITGVIFSFRALFGCCLSYHLNIYAIIIILSIIVFWALHMMVGTLVVMRLSILYASIKGKKK